MLNHELVTKLQQQVDKLESDVYDLECELKEEPDHDGV